MESYGIAELTASEELSSAENNLTLKQYGIDLGNQLEIEGISKEKICSIVAKLIVEKKAEKLKLSINEIKPSGYFYRVYEENDWVDTNLRRPRNNSTIETNKKQSTKLNIRYIDYLKRTKEICDIVIKKLENSADIEKSLNIIQIRILNHEWDIVLGIAEDAFNEKTKVALNMQHIILLEADTASSITNAGDTFQTLKLQEYDTLGKHPTPK